MKKIKNSLFSKNDKKGTERKKIVKNKLTGKERIVTFKKTDKGIRIVQNKPWPSEAKKEEKKEQLEQHYKSLSENPYGIYGSKKKIEKQRKKAIKKSKQ